MPCMIIIPNRFSSKPTKACIAKLILLAINHNSVDNRLGGLLFVTWMVPDEAAAAAADESLPLAAAAAAAALES